MKLIVMLLAMAVIALWFRLNTAIDVMYGMEAKIKLLASAVMELHNARSR